MEAESIHTFPVAEHGNEQGSSAPGKGKRADLGMRGLAEEFHEYPYMTWDFTDGASRPHICRFSQASSTFFQNSTSMLRRSTQG
jgi:hypothetical protein